MTDECDTDFGSAPAAPASQLQSWRDRRAARRELLKHDIMIPGWELIGPAVGVRFRPMDQTKLVLEARRAEKSRNKDASTVANAAALAEACIGVFQVDPETGEKVSIDPSNLTPNDEEWLAFGPELAEIIGEEDEALTNSAAVARALWDNDIALVAAADELYEWSKTMRSESDTDFTPGN